MEVTKSNNEKQDPRELLKITLRRIIVLIGFNTKNILPEQWHILINFILNEFKGTTAIDLEKAFTLGIKGQLDVDLTHYQNFNCLYISNVLQSFRRYQNRRKDICRAPARYIGI